MPRHTSASSGTGAGASGGGGTGGSFGSGNGGGGTGGGGTGDGGGSTGSGSKSKMGKLKKSITRRLSLSSRKGSSSGTPSRSESRAKSVRNIKNSSCQKIQKTKPGRPSKYMSQTIKIKMIIIIQNYQIFKILPFLIFRSSWSEFLSP